MAVQYLARFSCLREHSKVQHLYHKPTCSEIDCEAKTRTFHTMEMRYICTSCINNKKTRFQLISMQTARNFFALSREQLQVIPCARFRDSKSQYGDTPRWYLRQQVKNLSDNVWKNKVSCTKNSHYMAIKSEVSSDEQRPKWKEIRAARVKQLNKHNREEPMPPLNSSVSMDLAIGRRRDLIRYFKIPKPRTRQYKRRRGRPVTSGTENILIKEFTVGLNGHREESVVESDPKRHRLQTRRVQAEIRKKVAVKRR